MSNNNSIDREGLELLLNFDAKHFGKTEALKSYNETIASLANQPFLQAKFVEEAITAYKCPTQEEVAAYLKGA